jgi:acyl carrier protein
VVRYPRVTKDAITERLRTIFGDLFGIPVADVVPSASVRGTFQLDSMEIITLIEEVERTFGIKRGEASLDAYARLETVNDLVEHIAAVATR